MMLNSLKQVFVIFFVLLKTVLISADILTAPDGTQYLVDVDEKYNIFQVINACARSKGEPLTIKSQEKQDEIVALLEKNFKTTPRFWLGATDGFNKVKNFHRLWTSVSGNNITYTNWDPYSPDNYYGKEHCMQLGESKHNFLWNDSPCESKFGYICELYKAFECDDLDDGTQDSKFRISSFLKQFWKLITEF